MKIQKTTLMVLLAIICLGAGQSALAHENLYRLDMVYEGPVPTEFPAHVEFMVSEGHNCEHFKGTASADFDGSTMSNSVADDVVAITGIQIVDSTIAINYTVWGYDDNSNPPKFKANTCLGIDIGGTSDSLRLHTSCSQPIEINLPMEGESGGFFTILGGEGDCLPDGNGNDVDCPFDNKLYWLAGEYQIPCTSAANVTLNVYDIHHDDNVLKGSATGYFNGSSLSGIINDDVAQLWGAHMDGGNLIVEFESFGYEHDPAHFKAKTTFELVIEGCGTFTLTEYHTSCSQPVVLDTPLPADPDGSVTFTNSCGCEDGTVSTEVMDWGGLKSLYK